MIVLTIIVGVKIMNNLVYGIILSAVMFIGFHIFGLHRTISTHESTIDRLTESNSKKDLEVDRYRLSISNQNAKIEKLRLDKEKAEADLANWKKLPKEVRYEVIYKYINKEIIKSEECDDIKSILNSLSNINYNNL